MAVPTILASNAAFAQDADTNEIVVTAQRREQAVIDVPISVSVVLAQQVDNLNLSTFTSIAQQTPNFNITFNRGSNATPDLSIRGIRGEGSNGRLNESSVAVYVDDVYLGDESSLTGQMFDVERVEVLRGPQGTLFGRNTTGGLVQFISAAPTSELTGKASILYGSDNWVTLNGAISGSFGDHVRTRLAGQFEQHDGHFTNGANIPGIPRKLAAKKVWSIRSTTDFDLGDTSKLRLQFTKSKTNSETTPNFGLGVWKDATRARCARPQILAAQCVDQVILSGQPRQIEPRSGTAITELNRDELAIRQNLTSVTAKFEQDLGGATLINITNYTRFKSHIGLDGDASSTPSGLQGANVWAQLDNTTRQLSNELRVQGETDRLDWVGGLFLYKDKKTNFSLLTVRNNARADLQRLASNSRADTKSGALFGQLDWRFADQWTLSAGARYSIENRHLKEASGQATVVSPVLTVLPKQDILAALINLGQDPDPTTKDVTGRVSVTWEPTPDNSLYASYSRGAKSVSFSTFYSNPTPNNTIANARLTGPVGREHVDAFEIGSKNRFLGRALTLNLAAFYYTFDGKQELLSVADLSSGVPILSSQFLNVGTAELYGAELELNYTPNRRWDFNVSGGLLHTEITRSDLILNSPNLGLVPLEGLPIPQTPKWTLNAKLAHHLPVDGVGVFTFQAEARAQAKQNFVLTNDPIVDVPPYGIVNFRIMWESEDKKFNAQAFVTNAFNKDYFARLNETNIGAGALIAQMGEPRLWGVKLGVAL
jgi:iron complex outermembrane receptor protein